MSWNYRVVAWEPPKCHGNRLFGIAEVYYDGDGRPHSYSHPVEPLDGWDDLRDLKGTYDMIAAAFTKPVLNLDNFPNVWDEAPSDSSNR